MTLLHNQYRGLALLFEDQPTLTVEGIFIDPMKAAAGEQKVGVVKSMEFGDKWAAI